MVTLSFLLLFLILTTPLWFAGSISGRNSARPVVPYLGMRSAFTRWLLWALSAILAAHCAAIGYQSDMVTPWLPAVALLAVSGMAAWSIGAITERGQQIAVAATTGEGTA